MKYSKIGWCHWTVNLWWGCNFATMDDGSLSEECRHCYAWMMSRIFSKGKATWGPKGNRWIRHEAARRDLYKLDKKAHTKGVRERVFINSMSDTFEDRDDLNEARSFLWDACKFVTNLDILLLTKRPQNVNRMVPQEWLKNWPAHVWIGTSAGNQKSADERLPFLIDIPAKVRFVSAEPLLEKVEIDPIFFGGFHPAKIHWIIVGGESGGKARPMENDWARWLRDDCKRHGAAFYMKQLGGVRDHRAAIEDLPEDLRIREFPS
jgi:protein gp37